MGGQRALGPLPPPLVICVIMVAIMNPIRLVDNAPTTVHLAYDQSAANLGSLRQVASVSSNGSLAGAIKQSIKGEGGGSLGALEVDQENAARSAGSGHQSNLEQPQDQQQAADSVPPYMQHMTHILVILHLSVFITGIVGNALVCLSVYRNKSLQTVTNYYIVNLAVADFLVILICLPPTVYWDLTLTWNFGLVLCKLVLYLQSISVSVSVLTLTCISMDRWYAICRPLEFCSTKYRAKVTIGLIWLVSMLFTSPDLIYLTTKPLYVEEDFTYMDCTYSWPENNTKMYQLFIVVLLFIGPFVLMSISYWHIVNVLWRNETVADTLQHSMQLEDEQQFYRRQLNSSDSAQFKSSTVAASQQAQSPSSCPTLPKPVNDAASETTSCGPSQQQKCLVGSDQSSSDLGATAAVTRQAACSSYQTIMAGELARSNCGAPTLEGETLNHQLTAYRSSEEPLKRPWNGALGQPKPDRRRSAAVQRANSVRLEARATGPRRQTTTSSDWRPQLEMSSGAGFLWEETAGRPSSVGHKEMVEQGEFPAVGGNQVGARWPVEEAAGQTSNKRIEICTDPLANVIHRSSGEDDRALKRPPGIRDTVGHPACLNNGPDLDEVYSETGSQEPKVCASERSGPPNSIRAASSSKADYGHLSRSQEDSLAEFKSGSSCNGRSSLEIANRLQKRRRRPGTEIEPVGAMAPNQDQVSAPSALCLADEQTNLIKSQRFDLSIERRPTGAETTRDSPECCRKWTTSARLSAGGPTTPLSTGNNSKWIRGANFNCLRCCLVADLARPLKGKDCQSVAAYKTSKKYRQNLANYAAQRDKYRQKEQRLSTSAVARSSLGAGSLPPAPSPRSRAPTCPTLAAAKTAMIPVQPGPTIQLPAETKPKQAASKRRQQQQVAGYSVEPRSTSSAAELLAANASANGSLQANQAPQQQNSTNNNHNIQQQQSCWSHTRFCKLIESRKKAAKMLIVIVIMFGLCYLPVHFLNMLRYTVGLPQNDITLIASLVSHWLCYFNSAVNPLIYNLMSGKFRHEFANLFSCKCFQRRTLGGV